MQGCQPFSSRLLPSVNIGCRLPLQTHSVCVILMPAAWSGLLDYMNVYAPCMTSPKVDSTELTPNTFPFSSTILLHGEGLSVRRPAWHCSSAAAVIVKSDQPHAIAATCGVGTFKGAVFSRSHSSTAPDILGDAFSHTSL